MNTVPKTRTEINKEQIRDDLRAGGREATPRDGSWPMVELGVIRRYVARIETADDPTTEAELRRVVRELAHLVGVPVQPGREHLLTRHLDEATVPYSVAWLAGVDILESERAGRYTDRVRASVREHGASRLAREDVRHVSLDELAGADDRAYAGIVATLTADGTIAGAGLTDAELAVVGELRAQDAVQPDGRVVYGAWPAVARALGMGPEVARRHWRGALEKLRAAA